MPLAATTLMAPQSSPVPGQRQIWQRLPDAGDGNGYGFWDSSTNYAIWMSTAGIAPTVVAPGTKPPPTTICISKCNRLIAGLCLRTRLCCFSINPNSGVHSEVPVQQSYFEWRTLAPLPPHDELPFAGDDIPLVRVGYQHPARGTATGTFALKPFYYRDQSLVFYEQVPSFGHKKFELHGRIQAQAIRPGGSDVWHRKHQPTTDSTGGQLTLGSGNITLDNSGDRSGLLDIQNAGRAWTGVQFRSAGDHWSVMGNDGSFGLYDDLMPSGFCFTAKTQVQPFITMARRGLTPLTQAPV